MEGTIHGIIFALRALVPSLGIVIEKLKPKAKRDQRLIEEYKKRLGDLVETEGEYYKGLFDRQKQALQTMGGSILGAIEVNPLVQERKAKQEQGAQTNIEMGGVNIVVPEGTEENQARRIVDRVIDILQFRWNKEQETTGY